MLCGIASPISLLNQCAAQGNYHLALSHLIISSPEYCEFYRRQSELGVLVSVDNGLVEQGKSIAIEDVVKATMMVESNEFVLPDVLGDGKESYQATIQGLDEYQHLMLVSSDHQFIGVPHGSSVADWMECYLKLLQVREIRTIGISMFDSELFLGGRVGLLDYLEDMHLIDPGRAYHMLGCWRDIREAYGLSTRCVSHDYSHGWYAQPREYVRSMDTGLPVRWGVQGIRNPSLRSPRPPAVASHRKDDFFAPVETNDDIQWNINLYMSCCDGLVWSGGELEEVEESE